jgi:hypothetical protein
MDRRLTMRAVAEVVVAGAGAEDAGTAAEDAGPANEDTGGAG